MDLLNKPRKLLYEWDTRRKNQRTLESLEAVLDTREPILLVHQSGRGGSMTTVNSLRNAGVKLPIFHTHTLSPEDVRTRISHINLPDNKRPLNVRVSERIAGELEQQGNRHRHWKLITIFRDPVARNISEFFLSIDNFIPDFSRNYEKGKLDNPKFLEIFLEKFPHTERLKWLERQLESVFDIPVYSSPFPREKGFHILEYEGVDLLILKTEHLNHSFRDAFRDFLDIDVPELVQTHITEHDPSRPMYKDFVNTTALPPNYLDQMYQSEFVQHFYSPEEISTFQQKWSKSD